MSEPTAPSAAQHGEPAQDLSLPPIADIYADVDPSVPRTDAPADEPADAGAHC